MDIKDILSVGLTAEDFDTLLEGLKTIPEKAQLEALMSGTVGLMLGSLSAKSREKEMEQQMNGQMKEVAHKNAAREDDLVILKSKLIILKRLLLSNEAVRMVNEIVNTPPLQVVEYQHAA